MNKDERAWIEEGMELAKRATEKSVSLVLFRGQDENGEADIVITNVQDAAQLHQLVKMWQPDEEAD